MTLDQKIDIMTDDIINALRMAKINRAQFEKVQVIIKNALRDQIEECAKIADAMKERHAEAAHSEIYSHESRRHARGNAVTAEEVACQIRALASAPPEPVQSAPSK